MPSTASRFSSAGRDAGLGGRVGLRQVDHRARDSAAVPAHVGSVVLDGVDLVKADKGTLQKMRRKMQMIFQDPTPASIRG